MDGGATLQTGVSWLLKGAFVNFAVLLILCVFRPITVMNEMRAENAEHVEIFGVPTYQWAEDAGMKWYAAAVETSGVRAKVQESFGKLLKEPEWHDRMTAVFGAIQQFFIRCAWLMMWLPLAFPVALAFWIDGISQWQARRWTFAYPSPWEHAWSRRVVHLAPVAIITVLCLPTHVGPEFLPLILLSVTIAFNRLAANMQKKI
jgi:hypothetical protein